MTSLFFTFPAMAELTSFQRNEVMTTISDLEGSAQVRYLEKEKKIQKQDKDTLNNDIFFETENQLNQRLISLISTCEYKLYDMNSIDLEDLQFSLKKKSIMELVQYAKTGKCIL